MRKRTRAAVLVACAVVLTGCTVDVPDAGPSASVSPQSSAEATRAEPLQAEDILAFGGIAALDAGSDCTGTLIDTGASGGPAYMLTSARCVGGMGRSPQSTTIDAEWAGTAEFLITRGDAAATLQVDMVELAYSTMRHTDLAIVRLDATLGELEDLGLRALPITDRGPTSGDSVVVGVASQGADADVVALHRDDCTLGPQHTVIESSWIWFDVWSTDCSVVEKGYTGSPLLSVDGAGAPLQIVAMGETTAVGVDSADGAECTLGRPCELSDDGDVKLGQTGFAQSVAGVGRCFDASTGRFSTGTACPLPMSDVWTEYGGGSFRGGATTDAFGRPPEASLVGGSVGVVRTVVVPIGDGTPCLDERTYLDSAARVLPHAGDRRQQVGVIVPIELPEAEGYYLLCGVRARGYSGAASVLFQVDRTPPVIAAGAVVQPLARGGVIVRAHLDPPELAAVRFGWGARGAFDCRDTDQLTDFFVAPLVIEAEDLPAVYCIYGMDAAGNRTPVTRIDIPST